MLEEKKKAEKKSHESTLMRQIVYFLIFFIISGVQFEDSCRATPVIWVTKTAPRFTN